MHGTEPSLDRLDAIVEGVGTLLHAPFRIWRAGDSKVRHVAGPARDAAPFTVRADGAVEITDPDARVFPIPEADGYYVETDVRVDADILGPLVQRMLSAERDTLEVAEELAARYEEIDLLYTISDILGRMIGLEEAAEMIVREVSTVVGARRASIFVHDPEANVLRPVAGWGLDVTEFGPIDVEGSDSIAARVFRECRPVAGDAPEFVEFTSTVPRRQPYRGDSFLSIPIIYPDPDGVPRPVGVINLTDRLGADQFSSGHRKLVAAIAHQIGAAIENARLVTLDRQRQRVRRELELAHDLQLRLLPSPDVLAGRADVAARCKPGELVGGDFYQFVPLHGSEVGVMLGDVSTHGFPAALIMALVLSAAGIQAAASDQPEVALERLLASVKSELSTTEMFLSLIYGIIDTERGTLRYANAGHPHAFVIRADGSHTRLGATAPPLGLAPDEMNIGGGQIPLSRGQDLLLLFSDGIAEEKNEAGETFGENRVLEMVHDRRHQSPEAIVAAVFEAVGAFARTSADDQTLLVLKA